jgi:hypothetical protein
VKYPNLQGDRLERAKQHMADVATYSDMPIGGRGRMTSDERVKQAADAHPGFAAAQDFLNTLEPHAFTWKDPNLAPNPRAAERPNLGIYAQQVEKSPWGRAIVQQDPSTGLKTVDSKAMVGALAAGAGTMKAVQDDHAQRLEHVEQAMGISPFRPPPPTLQQRADAGLSQLAAMRGHALQGVAPGHELAMARADRPLDKNALIGALAASADAVRRKREEDNMRLQALEQIMGGRR